MLWLLHMQPPREEYCWRTGCAAPWRAPANKVPAYLLYPARFGNFLLSCATLHKARLHFALPHTPTAMPPNNTEVMLLN